LKYNITEGLVYTTLKYLLAAHISAEILDINILFSTDHVLL